MNDAGSEEELDLTADASEAKLIDDNVEELSITTVTRRIQAQKEGLFEIVVSICFPTLDGCISSIVF